MRTPSNGSDVSITERLAVSTGRRKMVWSARCNRGVVGVSVVGDRHFCFVPRTCHNTAAETRIDHVHATGD
jgi:hypothetical protein